MHAVTTEHLSKSYPVYARPADRLKELLSFGRHSYHSDFWALKDITLAIRRGTTFGIVGENGSGKSTLLQIIAGILQPTSGTAQAVGRVSALLELGSGFNPEFTGRENVFLNGSILGFSNREMERKFPAIAEFAEIGEFIEQPVKTYSSGMIVRLAFAVAIHMDPEILLVDEALAVGDVYFRHRCLRKIHEMHARGITIIFVSHETATVKGLCDEAAWLAAGQVAEVGNPERVVSKYLAAMVMKDSNYVRAHPTSAGEAAADTPEVLPAGEFVLGIPNIDFRYGSRRAEVLGIAILNSRGQRIEQTPPGEPIVVRITVKAHERIEQPIVGFMMRNHLGVDFTGINTTAEGVILPPMRPQEMRTVDFLVQLPILYPANFSLSPAIADGTLDSYETCDWIDNAIALQIEKTRVMYGYIWMPCTITVRAVAQSPGGTAVETRQREG